jgi:peptidyl-prolyl cis-trans isomerase SurA
MTYMRIISALGLLLLAAPLTAQTPAPTAAPSMPDTVLVDRVVAVVGDTTLLLSDIRARVEQEAAQTGKAPPTDPAQQEAMAREVMDQMVDDMLIVEAARREDLAVSDDDVKDRVEQQVNTVRQRLGGSEARLVEALAQSGMTLDQYRRVLEGQIRDELLVDAYRRKRLAGRARPLISEEQLRTAFEENKAALGSRPARVSFQQVMIEPQPSDSANAEALKTAREVLAKRYSEDPGTKEQGGSLGWFKQGRMVKPFEDAVFSMRPGQTSGIVKSEFGYHIIRLDKVRGAERQARHILIKPEISPADVELARVRADSVATAIRDGANVAALAKQYGTKPEESEAAQYPIASLPPEYRTPLTNAKQGDVVGPIEVTAPAGSTFAVVKVTENQPAGEYTLDDVRTQHTDQLKQQRMMVQIVQELREETFVKVLM